MKQATQFIIEKYPSIDVTGEQKQVEELQVLQQLVRFFENPSEEKFELNSILDGLQGEPLSCALQAIRLFFEKGTYLMPIEDSQPNMLIDSKVAYVNQQEFIDTLNENGQNYNQAKFSVYASRNKIPEPDLMLSNRKFWLKESVARYCNALSEVAPNE